MDIVRLVRSVVFLESLVDIIASECTQLLVSVPVVKTSVVPSNSSPTIKDMWGVLVAME